MLRPPATSSIPLLLALVFALVFASCGGAGGGGGGSGSGTAPAKPPTPPASPPAGTSMSVAERALALEVLDRVNAERIAAGVPPLAWHEGAAEVAFAHSLDMDVRDFFDHTNPDGELPWDRLTAAGIAWSRVGENIAWGYRTPEAVMDGWMNSAGHRANILNGSYTHLGIGVHDNGGSIWWTQVFLVPR